MNAAELDRAKRLAEDPAYFAWVALQSSAAQHGNQRCAARDAYYFGDMLVSAIVDARDRARLVAMAELAGATRDAPFHDPACNLVLDALRELREGDGPTGLDTLVAALERHGSLHAAGGRERWQRELDAMMTARADGDC